MHDTPHPFRILAVDDSAEDRLLLEQAVSRISLPRRVDLTTLEGGERLLSHLDRQPAPDLILLDLNMPRQDGLELLRCIRDEERFAPHPVVILTTSAREEDVLAAYREGASSFVVKPATFGELVETMQCLLTYWCRTARVA